MSLRQDVDQFIETAVGPKGLYELIMRCVDEGGATGLACLRDLAESDYGGITFKHELQAPSASCLLLFGEAGLRELSDIAIKGLDSRRASMSMELLANIAAGSATAPLSLMWWTEMVDRLDAFLLAHPELEEKAQRRLVDIVLAFQDEDDVTHRVGSALSNLTMSAKPAARKLFAAISARWLAISAPVLAEYRKLIVDQPDREPVFQSFLTAHPHVLDPFAVEVWPQPDLYGFRSPDYIIRRADNSYVVVEIECPGKALVTAGNQVTFELTHAVSQVTDYDHYLMSKYGDLRLHFPAWDMPELLVVCGVESSLSAEQKIALRNFNRGSRAKAVGFDWLADRAEAVSSNVVRGEIKVTGSRLT